MPVYNLEQYHALQQRRIAAYLKNAKRGTKQVAEFYAAKLRLYVPVKSGRLKRSITRRGGRVSVGALGADNFPYVHWINQTQGQGMQNLRVKPKGKSGKRVVKIDDNWVNVPGGRMRYGSLPSNWRWTGRVRFAREALRETRRFMGKISRDINRKSIMGEVR